MAWEGEYMYKEFRKRLPLNLQFFSEEPTPPTDPQPGQEPPQPQTLDDVLKDPKYQSEFDKKIAKALETAKGKWETDYAEKLEQAKSEAEKLAKMNKEEKEKYETQKRLDELEAREKAITQRELKATAMETLAEKNLPKELAEILNYTDADGCKTSIDAVEKAFQSAVEKAVNDRLRNKGTVGGTSTTKVETKSPEDMTYTEFMEWQAKQK